MITGRRFVGSQSGRRYRTSLYASVALNLVLLSPAHAALRAQAAQVDPNAQSEVISPSLTHGASSTLAPDILSLPTGAVNSPPPKSAPTLPAPSTLPLTPPAVQDVPPPVMATHAPAPPEIAPLRDPPSAALAETPRLDPVASPPQTELAHVAAPPPAELEMSSAPAQEVTPAGGDPPALVFDIGGPAEPILRGASGGSGDPPTMVFSDQNAPRKMDLAAKRPAPADQGGDPAPKSLRLARKGSDAILPVLGSADLSSVIDVVFPATGPNAERADGGRTADRRLAIIPLTPPSPDEPDDSRETIDTLTLGDYVARSVRHSEDLAADGQALTAAKYQAINRLTQLGPHFEFHADQGHEHSYSSVGTTPVGFPNHLRTDALATMSQPLFDPVVLASLDRDREDVRAAEMKRRMTEVNVAYEAVSAYFDLLDARLQLELASGHLKRMTDLVGYMTRRTDLGGASDADLERVKVVALTAERSEIDAKGALDAALSTLHRLTGITAVQLAAPSSVQPSLPDDSDTAFARLVKTNPDVRWAYIQIKIAHDDSLASFAQTLPKVTFDLGRFVGVNASGAKGSTVDDRALISAVWSFGAGSELAQARSQAAHQNEMKHRYYSILRTANDHLHTAYLTLKSLDGQRLVAWKELRANNKVTAAFDEQLFAANRSLLDVLDTYQKYYQSKANLVHLTITQIKTAYQVRQLIGDLNQDSLGDDAILSASEVAQASASDAPVRSAH